MWGINGVQIGTGEQKLAILFRAVIKRCVLAEGVACGTTWPQNNPIGPTLKHTFNLVLIQSY